MRTLTISSEDSKKGRSFNAELLADVRCNDLAPYGESNQRGVSRPVFAVFGGSDAEMRPFIANVRCGRVLLDESSPTMEFLRSAGFSYAAQRSPAGTTVTVWLHELFRHDPGMVDPSGMKFILMPRASQIVAQPEHAAAVEHLQRVAPHAEHERVVQYAPLFVSFVDRRTRAPIIPALAFQAQLLQACIDRGGAGWANTSKGFYAPGVTDLGYALPLAFSGTHEAFEKLLAEQVQIYFDAKSKTRRAA